MTCEITTIDIAKEEIILTEVFDWDIVLQVIWTDGINYMMKKGSFSYKLFLSWDLSVIINIKQSSTV